MLPMNGESPILSAVNISAGSARVGEMLARKLRPRTANPASYRLASGPWSDGDSNAPSELGRCLSQTDREELGENE
jgi:hypothetical protein